MLKQAEACHFAVQIVKIAQGPLTCLLPPQKNALKKGEEGDDGFTLV